MSLTEFIARDVANYQTEAERAAYRAGLSSAVILCDSLASEYELEHTARGKTTKLGRSLAYVARLCGDRITEFRETINVK